MCVCMGVCVHGGVCVCVCDLMVERHVQSLEGSRAQQGTVCVTRRHRR